MAPSLRLYRNQFISARISWLYALGGPAGYCLAHCKAAGTDPCYGDAGLPVAQPRGYPGNMSSSPAATKVLTANSVNSDAYDPVASKALPIHTGPIAPAIA
jgi:hypothetical protein